MTLRLAGVEVLGLERRRRWAAARVWAAHQAPYLATALLALRPVVVDQSGGNIARRFDLSAFPVDERWRVYLDPDVLAGTEVPVAGFWLVHQVTHLLRHHAARSPVTDPGHWSSPISSHSAEQRRWNAAGDAEINDDLCAGQLRTPEPALTPATLALPEGWTAEQYWDALDGCELAAGYDCGSGCDGTPRPWDGGGPGLTGTGASLVEAEVARRIREHQRTRGDVPAGWQRWADEVLEPTVSWQRVLASTVRRGVAEVAGRVDFTYRRPSRRSAAVPGVVLPSLRQPLPRVAMVIDTSGSVSDQMLGQALAEVGAVLRSVGIGRRHLRVVCCDAQAYEAQRVVDARSVRLAGGGGTDMGVGLDAAVDLRPRPDLVVVLTDGCTPWPDRPPRGTRVLVGLLDPAGSVPPWATSVSVGR